MLTREQLEEMKGRFSRWDTLNTSEISMLLRTHEEQVAKIEQLRAEVARLRQDAARWKWVERNISCLHSNYPHWVVEVAVGEFASFRESIDAAMSEKGAGE